MSSSGLKPEVDEAPDIALIALTDYQAGQLLHKHLAGDFCYKNSAGHKVPNKAWRLMIQVLIDKGLISTARNLPVTNLGREWLFKNVDSIKGLDCGCPYN